MSERRRQRAARFREIDLYPVTSEAHSGGRTSLEVLDGIIDGGARIVVRRCAAFEGAKRANLPRQDQACVTCETLWDAWFKALLPDAEISVAFPHRQGMGDPVCEFLVVQRS